MFTTAKRTQVQTVSINGTDITVRIKWNSEFKEWTANAKLASEQKYNPAYEAFTNCAEDAAATAMNIARSLAPTPSQTPTEVAQNNMIQITTYYEDNGAVVEQTTEYHFEFEAWAFINEEQKWEGVLRIVCQQLGVNREGDFAWNSPLKF